MARDTAHIAHNAERSMIVRELAEKLASVGRISDDYRWMIETRIDEAIDQVLEARRRRRLDGGATRSCGCPWCDRCEW